MLRQISVLGLVLFVATFVSSRNDRQFAMAAPPIDIGAEGPALPGTQPLRQTGDLAEEMLTRCHTFVDAEGQRVIANRRAHWQSAIGADNHAALFANARAQIKRMLGVVDPRVQPARFSPSLDAEAVAARAAELELPFAVNAVRWPVLADPTPTRQLVVVEGEGLLLEPADQEPLATVVVIPHCEQTPEQIAGLDGSLDHSAKYARHLTEAGFRVVIPFLISRTTTDRSPPERSRGVSLTHREFVYRSSFDLGRHPLGFDLQKILALLEILEKSFPHSTLGMLGYGEGGRLALLAAALEDHCQAVCISGAFGGHAPADAQPLDRNTFGLRNVVGDAELARMITPNTSLIIDRVPLVEQTFNGAGGAPSLLRSPINVDEELAVLANLHGENLPACSPQITRGDTFHPSNASLQHLARALRTPENTGDTENAGDTIPLSARTTPSRATAWKLPRREQRQIEQLTLFNELLLSESRHVRRTKLSSLPTASSAAYQDATDAWRTTFYDNVIGRFQQPLEAAEPRTRLRWRHDDWTAYEVVLNVFEGVFAYGVLILPNDIAPGERRPVVVCQHGLEGRPTDVFLGDHRAYHDYAARLAEQGYITFAPQNLYLFKDRFRGLQRKANPLGKSLFSFMIPQHQQIVRWLGTLPQVDPDRIAFYGLSYGGKSAMRIPAVVTEYCLSICSADFNEWVLKNASTRHPFSYVWTGEYEIFEFDLANQFNYAEMAALIAPRPFMVERGHADGVGWDEWVAFEYAKVRHLYAARLKLPRHTAIEFFDGPHTIHGQGTFSFLREHLRPTGPPTP